MSPVTGNKKIALALGAGSARGLAHIGVIQVLREEQVPIHMVAGSSIGAVTGAFLAAGMDFYRLGRMVEEMDFRLLLDVQVPRLGFIRGRKIYQLLKLLTQGKNFADLELPLAVVATDLESGERVVIDQGEVAEALRASISIPGVFQPVRWQNRWLVDGAVSERLPVNVARGMGADLVIGVDVTYGGREVEISNTLNVVLQAIELLEKQLHDLHLAQADILIQPKTGCIGNIRFDRASECIRLGREAAREALPRIWKALTGEGFS